MKMWGLPSKLETILKNRAAGREGCSLLMGKSRKLSRCLELNLNLNLNLIPDT